MNIFIKALLLLSLPVVLVGCTHETNNTNASVDTNSTVNTSEATNTNQENPINTNGNQGIVNKENNQNTDSSETNTNTSTDNSTETPEIDTSDWLTYSNDQIGIQFDYPVSESIKLHLIDCTKGQCASSTGFSYYINTIDQNGELQLTFAGAATPDFQADRDLGFFDVAFFRNSNDDYEAVLSGGSGFIIYPIKQALYKNGEVVIYEINDLPSYPQLLNVIPERKDDKVAIYNFNQDVNGFKSISIILTPEMNEQDIDRILNSVVIL